MKKKGIRFPKMTMGRTQRLWLKALYEDYNSGRESDIREIKARLSGKIPRDFDARGVDWRLAPGGRYLTLLGMWHVNSSDSRIKLLDELLVAIRQALLVNPTKDWMSLKEVHLSEPLEAEERGRLLGLIRDITNRFFIVNQERSADGLADLGIKLGIGEAAFDFFYQYDGLEDLIRRQLAPGSEGTFVNTPEMPGGKSVVPNTAFILMWMSRQQKGLVDVYNAIKRVCDSFGIRAFRIDDVERSEQITDTILENIEKSQYIIADLTGSRPNVYYEIGYAQAFKKKPILIKRKGTKVHFDLYVHKATEYESVTDLENQLRDRLEKILGRSPKRR